VRSARRLPPALLLAIAPLIFFHEVCLGGQIFLLRDLFNWFYPWRTFAAQSLARGEFPLWNPYSYAGTPFLANMQSGLLYPPNVVFWLFDFPIAMRLFVIIQFGLTAWFMFLLLRALACRVPSALTGAFAYAYGGWMIVHIEFPNKLAAAGWLPLILLGLLLWWRGSPWKGLATGALATACCVTAGYPQTTFTMMLGAGVFWAAYLGRELRRGFRQRSVRSTLSVTMSLPLIAALGSLIAAAQIVPFLEALGLSTRGGAAITLNPLNLALSPIHFLDLVYPRVFGLPGYSRYWGGNLLQFWLGHFHVGLITLALAAVAAAGLLARPRAADDCPSDPTVRDRRFAVWAGLALLLLASAFCLGNRTPLAPFCMAWLPGFAKFRWLSTTSILIAFALCWLGALGLEAALDSLARKKNGRWERIITAPAALVAVVGLVSLGITAVLSPSAFEAIVTAAVSQVALPAQLVLISSNLAPARADAIRSALLAVILASAWVAARSGRIRPQLFERLVPLLVFAELWAASGGINYTASPRIYRDVPRILEVLRGRANQLSRIYVPDSSIHGDRSMYGSDREPLYRWAAEAMIVNLNLPHGIFSASDGDPMSAARERRYHRLLEDETEKETRRRLLALENVATVLDYREPNEVVAAEVPDYLPRAYVAPGARKVATSQAHSALRDPGWNPLREALVEDDFPGSPRPASQEPLEWRVHDIAYSNNSVSLDVELSRGGYLILADTIYPGWEATVDSKPTPIFTANYLFRGIDLPPGRHDVRFDYRPSSFRWGVAGSIVGLMATLAAIVISARRRERDLLIQ
jgi:hypothetical protein